MGKVKKSKRWGGEWTRAGKRGKGAPAPRAATLSGSDISWTTCNSAPQPIQITTPAPHHSVFFTGHMPFLLPNQQHQGTEGNNAEQTGNKYLKLLAPFPRATVT